MSLRSKFEGVWIAVRGPLIRLNQILFETGASDDDLVFNIRRGRDRELAPTIGLSSIFCAEKIDRQSTTSAWLTKLRR
jgi:hypothetical protein